MLRCGLLGEKLGHSFSPAIHRRLGDYEYVLIEKAPEEVGEFLQSGSFHGINVTIPYKKTVIPYCAELSDTARAIGAVNTVVRREDGTLYGDNTDAYGFTCMVKKAGIEVAGAKALVLGSGGAARSACAALEAMGAERITVISRTPGDQDWGEKVAFKGYGALAGMTGSLMINATPVGMHPNTDASPVTEEQMRGFTAFADLIYNPSETLFTRQAKAMGCPRCTGLYMLVAQAVKAEEIWWEAPVPASVTQAIYEEMRKELHL